MSILPVVEGRDKVYTSHFSLRLQFYIFMVCSMETGRPADNIVWARNKKAPPGLSGEAWCFFLPNYLSFTKMKLMFIQPINRAKLNFRFPCKPFSFKWQTCKQLQNILMNNLIDLFTNKHHVKSSN